MKQSERLLKQIKKINHQGLPVTNLFVVLKEYFPLGQYMRRKFGWKSWYSFWYTKLFVADEGGEYAILDRLFQKYPKLLKNPFKLEFEHTTICNKKCIFCERTYWNEKNKRISYAQLKQTLDPIKSLKWVNIAGEGSSFLNRDFIKMLKYLRKRHINVNFVDEFDFFNEDIAKTIIKLGINSLYISFDAATKETYEHIKVGCDYDRALKNIRTLLKLKKEMNSPFPVIHFRFIVTSLNYMEMPQFIKLISTMKNRGVRARVEFVGLLVFPEIDKYYFPMESIPEKILVETFETALKNSINLYFTHAGKALPPIDGCTAWTEPFVLIDGEVISCCAINMSNNRKFLRDNSFGNVYNKPFMDIWNSQKYKQFRRTINDCKGQVPKTCYGCRAYNAEERAGRYGILED